MSIHPHARSIVSKLTIPSPIKKYFSGDTWEIDLSNNTNPYGEGFSEYPDVKQDELKSLYLHRIQSLNLRPDNLLFTVGLMEGIDILLRALCEPNKDIICILHPTFSAYEHWGLLHNLEIKNIPLSGENLNTFSLEQVIQLNPKIVFMCNPNNPIGTSVDLAMIEKLCESIDGFVVVDEAYVEFSSQPSSLIYLNKYKNLIILRTLSKAWGLAGVRCGIILADALIIHTLRYVQLPFSFSSPSQELVKQCLMYPERILASWEKIKNDRQIMIDQLSTLESVEKVFKSDTNFIMLILKDSEKVMALLKEDKIHVMECFQSIPRSIRVSIGTEDQNRKFIDVIYKASEGLDLF